MEVDVPTIDDGQLALNDETLHDKARHDWSLFTTGRVVVAEAALARARIGADHVAEGEDVFFGDGGHA